MRRHLSLVALVAATLLANTPSARESSAASALIEREGKVDCKETAKARSASLVSFSYEPTGKAYRDYDCPDGRTLCSR